MSAQDAPIDGLEDLDEATRALVVAKTREHRARMQELVDLGLIEAVGTFVVPKNKTLRGKTWEKYMHHLKTLHRRRQRTRQRPPTHEFLSPRQV